MRNDGGLSLNYVKECICAQPAKYYFDIPQTFCRKQTDTDPSASNGPLHTALSWESREPCEMER